jgi:hypothetical protein
VKLSLNVRPDFIEASSDALDPARGYPHRIKELLRSEDKEANYTDEQ